jgi:hypothetical protein|nr:hypothetical protein [uncultured Romboutsia sp.]
MRKYGVKYRTIVDEDMNIVKNVYSPILYINNEEIFISQGDTIMEFNNREDALTQAKETYIKIKDKI